MNPLKMTKRQLASQALVYWANYIETGQVWLSATDAASSDQQEEVRALSTDQMRLIVRLRDTAERLNHD